jgi:hypothetical protein
MKAVAMLSLFFVLVAAAPAWAARSGVVDEWYLFPSFQYYSWSEFAGNGSRFLRESDPLYGAGGAVTFNLYDHQLLLKLKGELFGGDVDYDGETQPDVNPNFSRLPVKTDVIYFGGRLQADVGWRFPVASASVEPFAGIGYRGWLRSLQDSNTFSRNGIPVDVVGYDEWWNLMDTKLGARFAIPLSNDFKLVAEGGARYPFLIRNTAYVPFVNSVTVSPRGNWSGFAEVGCQYGRFRPTLFYEGYRADQSPINDGFVQPRTASDIYGINIAIVF